PLSSLLSPLILVFLVWLYSRRGGIKTLVWTDSLQTFCMLGALLLIIYKVMGELGFGLTDAVQAVAAHEHSRMFVFDDWASPQNFWKQFVSGIFIVVVMTGLDQDIMQKNLTCRTLREAQKDMCSYGFAFMPLNLLFMGLGILLLLLADQRGMAWPTKGDELLPMFAATGELGTTVQALFALGLVAASFSTADSAMTSITTSTCVDIFERPADERLRRRVHLGVAAVMVLLIWAFGALNSTSVIDAVYTLVSYTYGPLLGLFAFGLLTKRNTCDRAVPYIAVLSPLVCLLIDKGCNQWLDYHFGYELLMLNGALTFLGLCLVKEKSF
ncbi:MAG: sodium:solute symporter, partial [Bacteroidaceae bacterium]|nr:sodium:solute symporter [Bacteroidaceae bacterium]